MQTECIAGQLDFEGFSGRRVAIVGTGFLLAGAWPVLPFLGTAPEHPHQYRVRRALSARSGLDRAPIADFAGIGYERNSEICGADRSEA
jgi:hypothetical protein